MKNSKIAIVLILAFILSGCDIFNNKPDRNILDDIESSVWDAKAPQLETAMDAPPETGTAVPPPGPIKPKPKLRIPFRVSFTPAKDYVFVEWQAFLGDNVTELVSFADKTNPETTAEILDEQVFTIKPYVVERPKINTTNLPTGSYSRVPANYPIRIRFKNPVDLINRENISITAKGEFGTQSEEDLLKAGIFANLDDLRNSTDHRFLELVYREGKNLPFNSDITIIMKGNIRAEISGETTVQAAMQKEQIFSFGTGDEIDANPPVVTLVRGAVEGSFTTLDETTLIPQPFIGNSYDEDRRIPLGAGGKRTVYILFNAVDEFSGVTDFIITEQKGWELNGSPVSGSIPHDSDNTPALRQQGAGMGRAGVLAAKYDSVFNKKPFIIAYTLQGTENGIIDLYVRPADTFENRDTPEQARIKGHYLRVALNNTLAYTGSLTATIGTTETDGPVNLAGSLFLTNGRRRAVLTVTAPPVSAFTENGGRDDFPPQDNMPKTTGAIGKIFWQAGLRRTGSTDMNAEVHNDWSPLPASGTTITADVTLPDTFTDGEYEPFFRYTNALISAGKDDELSAVLRKKTATLDIGGVLKLDTTPPAAPDFLLNQKENSSGNASYVVNITTVNNAILRARDEGSGIDSYMIKTDNTAPAADDSDWVTWPAGKTELVGLSLNLGSISSGGTKTLYAFVKDRLGYVSSVKALTIKYDPGAQSPEPAPDKIDYLTGSFSQAQGKFILNWTNPEVNFAHAELTWGLAGNQQTVSPITATNWTSPVINQSGDYSFSLRAVNRDGIRSLDEASLSRRADMAGLENLSGAFNEGIFRFEWKNPDGFDHGLVSWGVSGGSQSEPEELEGTSWTSPLIDHGGSYTFSFKAVNAHGLSSPAETLTLRAASTPAPVDELQVTFVEGKFKLTWRNPPANFSYVEINWGKPGVISPTQATTSINSWSTPIIDAAGLHTFSLTVISSEGIRSTTVTRDQEAAIKQITNLIGSFSDAGKFTLQWTNPPANFDHAELLWGPKEGTQISQSITGNTWTSSTQSTEGDYTFSLRAVSALSGGLTATEAASITLSTTPAPAPITGLSGSFNGDTNTFTLTWTNPPSYCDSVEVSWGLKDGSPTTDTLGKVTTETFIPLSNGMYTFSVRAVNAQGLKSPAETLDIRAGAAPVDRYVTKTGAGAKTGESWAAASDDLQKLMDESDPIAGAVIHIGAGTYTPKYRPGSNNESIEVDTGTGTSQNERDRTFILREGVELRGGYIAAGETLTDDARKLRFNKYGVPSSESYRAVLSGDFIGNDGGTAQSGFTGMGENAYHVVLSLYLTGATKLDGLTIRGGNANGSGALTIGILSPARGVSGGMYNSNSSPVLNNVTISGNYSAGGGGMYNYNYSSPVLNKVTISGNYSAGDGGGMYNYNYSSPVLNKVTISGNNAQDLSGGRAAGGGMYNYSNSAPVLNDVTISGNSASGSYLDAGGGMYNSEFCSPKLTNVTISGNNAQNGGGMYNSYSSAPVLTNVVISGNKAASNGGGMYNESSSPVLTNVTIAGNTAEVYGGAMYNTSSAAPKIRNSIIWGNSSDNIYNVLGTSPPVVSYSIVQRDTVYSGTGNSNADPLFVTLQLSTAAPTSTGDYHVQSGSPAINKGHTAYYALTGQTPNISAVTTDRDNTARIKGGTVDMGAYEKE